MTAFYILAGLQLLDLISTVYFMSHPRLGLVEANPLLAKLFQTFDPLPVLLVAKGGFLYLAYTYYPEIPQGLVWLACGGYSWVVFNNFKMILRGR